MSRIKRLMNSSSDRPFEPRVEDVRRWFAIINAEIFKNTLPKIDEIDIRWRRKKFAAYEAHKKTGKTKLLISKRYRSKKFFVEILAHELIHHHQFIFSEPMGHGPSFQRWVSKFNKRGLDLAIYYGED